MPSASVKDVAALAGVSVGTVSNVLNRPERVSDAVVQRVQTAIAELGFVRNNAARQLRMGQGSGIGMVVLDVGNPFFASLIRGAEDRAARDRLSVLVGNSDENEQREAGYLTMFEQERIRGVLISPVGDATPSLHRLRDRGIPSVLVDRTSLDRSFSSVAVDDVAGGRLAAAHLIEQGFRRIAFAGGPFAIEQVAHRYRGATEEVASSLPGGTVEKLETENLTIEGGQRVGAALAERAAGDRPDAVFAANDLVAIGLLQSLLQAGIRVPEDVALIGYDDIAFASAAVVPLSSIRQPSLEIGSTAMDLLLQLTAKPDAQPVHVEFQPALVARASSAALSSAHTARR
ncbi:MULTISPECIES: LacI family DNA-binding transcriptional regulator [unclassified Leifsonia]|uniref:LacI family DNA-binding transcriptional regulator n=1 Tax=unclassified Leifsonia TaxID=2663824 RepID=UPI0008A77E8F|nr:MULTISPECIES: LacI family DNA-binding transcriptional regulator [unclassified Leifsonia]SEH81484.1 transcriptional regulator, LacI family [Leifsonia sp. CL154]SFL43991.1 transcriptional regulator, LacI family [Leifsonia sp. CL147]